MHTYASKEFFHVPLNFHLSLPHHKKSNSTKQEISENNNQPTTFELYPSSTVSFAFIYNSKLITFLERSMRKTLVLALLAIQPDEAKANKILVRKRDEGDVTSNSIPTNSNDISSARKAMQRKRQHPSLPSKVRLVGDQTNKSIQDTSLRLGSESLADRWSFLLDRTPYDNHVVNVPSFTAQLRALEESTTKPTSVNSNAIRKKRNRDERSLKSVSWSIALSTGTILAMTSMTQLSSLAMGMPSNESQTPLAWWKNIFALLSNEFDITFSTITAYLRNKFIPLGIETLQRMILMELWRSFWLKIFAGLRDVHHSVFKESYYESIWESYAPGWLRRGVRAYFVKKVQADLQMTLGTWVGKGWDLMGGSVWLDFQFVQDGKEGDDGTIDTEEYSTITDDIDSLDSTYIDEGDGVEIEIDDVEIELPGDDGLDIGIDIDDSLDMEG